jgi:hypothetical protein
VSAHFVLDQNFPILVTGLEWPQTLQATRLLDHAPDLTRDVEDWQVLIELSRRGGCDGFITNDRHILTQAPEMYALSRTHLALAATQGVGHEPFRATGLVLLHIEEVAKRLDGKPHTFVLRPNAGMEQKDPYDHLNRIAKLHNVHPAEVIAAERSRIEEYLRNTGA